MIKFSRKTNMMFLWEHLNVVFGNKKIRNKRLIFELGLSLGRGRKGWKMHESVKLTAFACRP